MAKGSAIPRYKRHRRSQRSLAGRILGGIVKAGQIFFIGSVLWVLA
jgi:hypothetical protein